MSRFENNTWIKKGCSVNGNDIIESADSELHILVQEVPAEVMQKAGSSAIFSIDVEPVGREHIWLGARENNQFFMALFDLSEEGETVHKGSEIARTSVSKIGSQYRVLIHFEDTLSDSERVSFCIGTASSDYESDRIYQGDQRIAFRLYNAQLTPGMIAVDPLQIKDRSQIDSLKGPDARLGNGNGNQEFHPDTYLSPLFHRFDGINDIQLTSMPAGWSSHHAFSTLIKVRPRALNGEQHIWGQWEADQKSWQVGISDNTFFVRLSSNGTETARHVIAPNAIRPNEEHLLGFSWNGIADQLTLFVQNQTGRTLGREVLKDEQLEAGQIFKSTRPITEGGTEGGFHASCDIYHKWFFQGIMNDTSFEEFASKYLSGTKKPIKTDPEDPELNPSMPDYAIGNPRTEAELREILRSKKGVKSFLYVDNRNGQGGNDNNNGSSERPFRTIQKLLDVLQRGQAGIIRGSQNVNQRYFESCRYKRSGESVNNRIWLCGSPEATPILDASEPFDRSWELQASGNWRASYGERRVYSPSKKGDEHSHPAVWMTHQLISSDRQLKRISSNQVPELEEGQCYFQIGNGSFERPQFVHCKLHGDKNPNELAMRIGSAKTYLLDHHKHKWEEFPGNDVAEANTKGKIFIGLWNLHFRFGCSIRKRGMTAVRGQGWHVEKCSFAETNATGLSYQGEDHILFNNHFSRNGQYGYRELNTNGCIFQRNYITENNLHDFPSSFAAGGCKVSLSAQERTNHTFENYWADNRGVGEWYDIYNGSGKNKTPCIHSHHNFYARNMRGGYFNEFASIFIIHEDCVVFNTKANTAGPRGEEQTLGPGIRTQASSRNTHRRVVSVYNEGKGILYKAQDRRARANNDYFKNCAFIENAKNPDIDQHRCEFQGGDDIKWGYNWKTSKIENLLVANSNQNIPLFIKRSPQVEKTRNPNVFQNWSGAINTQVAQPGEVVEDFRDEFKCYKFKDGFKEWEPREFTHPKRFASYWDIPSAG